MATPLGASAFLGSQTILSLGNGASPEVFTTIGYINSIDPISVQKDLVEVTHLQSTAKEFIGGLGDGQTFNVTCNFDISNTQQILMLGYANTVSGIKNFKYITPAEGYARTFSFSGVVMGSSIGPTTPNTATTITYSIKISGPVVGPTG